MSGRGRPLRFVAVVAFGWASARTVMLWPEGASLPEAIEVAFPLRPAAAATPQLTESAQPAIRTMPVAARMPANPALLARESVVARGDPARINLAMLGLVAFGREEALGIPPGPLPRRPPPAMLPEPAQPARWSASAWFVTRRGAASGGAMLGGDQAGLRIAYHPGSGRIALFARLTAPLAGRGKEAAAGVDWQPTAAPVRVIAEYRAGLDGTPGGPALGLVAGVYGVSLPLDFRLEAYGQAGAVVRKRIDPFADGALRVTREVARAGDARLDVGAGAWGAAQREAARLDVGPSAIATVPVGDSAIRVALDWRERVAGDARPGSGPALSLGADF
ncbi:hypothetical protein OK349_13145 [Sphingomonas sp. BT-65]|uniref:hypothetical protein n=1 Tax=Sphingomonas sp. BT-65 TaxID=2989821 RepID=UPI002235B897|nr:hypothetical protein [Sphingomonas sp. BT-65]MCW4462657.1 hypothetical protein [Sphingomonas sp. BT-65]